MECGLVGFSSTGKSTLLAALVGGQSKISSSGSAMKPAMGMAPVPDPRLETIAALIPPEKIIPVSLTLIDIPGLPSGQDPKQLNNVLSHLRQVDALCLVLRCYDAPGLPEADPVAEARAWDDEVVLADLIVVESALDKAKRAARGRDPEAPARQSLLEKVSATLEAGMPVREMAKELDDTETRLLSAYGLITSKPVLFVANVGEDDPSGQGAAATALAEYAVSKGALSVPVCAVLEAEIAEMDVDDRNEMLEGLGLSEPAIGPLARALYQSLGLACFYTAGEKEVRAWTIVHGATAPQAAGAIHSDIERGFIRAECFHVDDLVAHESEKAIRGAGKLRSEGKSYVMQDGDVVHFLFNV
ncbi:MAG: DUF933 domain-containing protein [Phycisphaerales bacterium]|nr:DUF933 domain-containing protein [Phycisphaerales bacterium]